MAPSARFIPAAPNACATDTWASLACRPWYTIRSCTSTPNIASNWRVMSIVAVAPLSEIFDRGFHEALMRSASFTFHAAPTLAP
ncbi:MAG: hypothetical protein U0163_05420 [Gemmatimonadaceae bacterium]